MNNETSIYEILDKDPGHHVVSYLSSLHPLLCLAKNSSELLSLCPTIDAFRLRFCHHKPEGEGYHRLTRALDSMRSHAKLIPGALSGAVPLSTFGESVDPFGARAARTAESFFIADFEQAQNYAPNPWDQPDGAVYRQVRDERQLTHEAVWEALQAADRSPYEESEAADLLRYNQAVAEFIHLQERAPRQRSQRDKGDAQSASRSDPRLATTAWRRLTAALRKASSLRRPRPSSLFRATWMVASARFSW